MLGQRHPMITATQAQRHISWYTSLTDFIAEGCGQREVQTDISLNRISLQSDK